jgi:hypothetical protein
MVQVPYRSIEEKNNKQAHAKSNDIGTEQHQIQQAIENNPTTGEPYNKSACTCLNRDVQQEN